MLQTLMIGAAVGAVFGGSTAELINSAIPGDAAAVAQPQAYALVGMAATLASVCSVPLTSVLLLFELTKDYRILLPLMGAVGLAIWVPSVVNESKTSDALEMKAPECGYSSLSTVEDKGDAAWRHGGGRDDLQLSVFETGVYRHGLINEETLLDDLKVSEAVSMNFVKVLSSVMLKEAIDLMHDKQQNCVLVVDAEDVLEGILTVGDIRKRGLSTCGETSCTSKGDSAILDVNACSISSYFTRGFQYRGGDRGLVTCFPDTDLTMAKELMEAKGVKQLPVVNRGGHPRKRKLVALLHYDSIGRCLREEVERRKSIYQQRRDDLIEITTNWR